MDTNLGCRLDIPKAPLLLGNLLGQAVSEKMADGAALQKLCEPIEDTEARRELLSSVLKYIQVSCLYVGCINVYNPVQPVLLSVSHARTCYAVAILSMKLNRLQHWQSAWQLMCMYLQAVAYCLCAQAKDGQDATKNFGASKALKLGSLLQGNPEFESHLESADEYMKRQSLGFIVIS